MMRFQPSHLSRRNGRQGDVEAVNKNWAKYVECAQEQIGKGKTFFHPMGKAFHPLATSDKSAFRLCQDKYTYFKNEILRYNKENEPISEKDFNLQTFSAAEVRTYAEGEVGGEAEGDIVETDGQEVSGGEEDGGGGLGVGTMVLIGVGAIALVGGAYWYVTRD
jgi:hypothetical protein